MRWPEVNCKMGQQEGMTSLGYYCPKCGTPVDTNIFFQVTGQCMCSHCGEIVDLSNEAEVPLKREVDNEHPERED
jgi:uncharacterized Zn finger protein (UPF0148 family)